MEQKKILVAIDGSAHSNRVVDTAIQYAKLLEAKVLLVHCHRRFPTILGEPHRNNAIVSTIRESEILIEPFSGRLRDAEVAFEERLMEEPAAAVIVDIAKIQKCELIIMGSRGLTSLEGLIVGSVTTRVLHTTPCSVLVVK
jgi:nucleotide-binding universal stress UspA family protein